MKYDSNEFSETLKRAQEIIKISNTALPIGLAHALIATQEELIKLRIVYDRVVLEASDLKAELYSISRGLENTSYLEYRTVEKIVDLAFKEQTISSDMANALAELRAIRESL